VKKNRKFFLGFDAVEYTKHNISPFFLPLLMADEFVCLLTSDKNKLWEITNISIVILAGYPLITGY